jgi:hypothetical protein
VLSCGQTGEQQQQHTGVALDRLDGVLAGLPVPFHLLALDEVVLPRRLVGGVRRALLSSAGPLDTVQAPPQLVVIRELLVVLVWPLSSWVSQILQREGL